MTDRGIARLLDYLRRETPPGPELLPDATLLARFAASRDEAAFELLVRRHGPMVFATARRILRDSHSAEDVVQAAFLALARKARALRHGGAVAGWLHRVTLRSALRMRASRRSLPPVTECDSGTPEWELIELRSVLDEEVAKLPARFRDAVVHCYLAGRTAEEAAEVLRCPRGTVLSRLANARERLRKRLTHRGYGLPAAGIAALWAGEAATALSPTVISLAMSAVGPATAIAPGIIQLTEGVLHAMLLTKIKTVAAIVIFAGVVGLGVGQLGAGPPKKESKDQPTPESPAAAATKPATVHIEQPAEAEARRDAAEKQFIEVLSEAAMKRVDLRLRIEDLKEQIEELRQKREPVQERLSAGQEIISDCEREIFTWETRICDTQELKDNRDTQLKIHRELMEKANKALVEYKQRDAKLRVEITQHKRELMRLEEELTLQEQLTSLKAQRLTRQMQ
ncbi:MAG: sigma-70 family RNA polymerase sigma factor [Gemmataceae bacterium]